MTPPKLTEILVDDGPGCFRAVAIDNTGHAWRQFSQFWDGEGEQLRLGARVEAIVRANEPQQGGVFLECSNSEQIFMRVQPDHALHIGQKLAVECVSEARHGKLSRVMPAISEQAAQTAYEVWKASLGKDVSLNERSDSDAVNAVFEDALAPQVQIKNGGNLYIEHTRALTAIDIDSAGRASKGSAGARALSLNRDAALEAARQAALRDIGGLVVLDCVDPLNKSAASQIQATFKTTFEAVSKRPMTVLTPSKLGLMEISVQHGAAPLSDKMLDQNGAPKPETKLLSKLREVERELNADRTRFLTLALSESLHATYLSRKQAVDTLLKSRFMGRLRLDRTGTDDTRISPQ